MSETPTRQPEQVFTVQAAMAALVLSLVVAWTNLVSIGPGVRFWTSFGLSVLSATLLGKALAVGRGRRFRTASALLLLLAAAWLGVLVIALLFGPH
jgi:hypothetical protein